MTATFTVDFKSVPLAAKRPVEGAAVSAAPQIPRVARLLALAHRIERLVRERALTDYADAARLGYVTRARVSQVLNLLNLAPRIQAEILDMRVPATRREVVGERDLRPIAAEPCWRLQERRWREVRERQAFLDVGADGGSCAGLHQ